MRSASRSPRLICHQPALAVPRGFAERRSGYSDNSTARTSHLGDAKTTDHPGGIAPCGPRSRTFAPCGVLFPTLDEYAILAPGPTRANVAYRPAFPPVVGTTKKRVGVLGSGNSSRLRHSLFHLSDQKPEPHLERKCDVRVYPS